MGRRQSRRAFTGCLGGFLGSSPCLRWGLPVHCLLDFLSRARPSGTLHGFPYCGVFYDGGSGPPRGQQSSIPSLVPTSGVYLQPVPVSPSVFDLTDPRLTRTLRSRDSGGSHLVCLQRDSHRKQQSFSSALTRFLAMTGSLPHRLHAHQTTPCTLHATPDLVYSVSYRLEQPIYPGGLGWSPHLLPILCTCLTSSPALPLRYIGILESYSDSKSGFQAWLCPRF